MRLISREPSLPLRPFVESLWYHEAVLPNRTERVLPSGKAQMLVDLAEQTKLGIFLCGPATSAHFVSTRAMRRILGVSFRAGGAYPFLGVPCVKLQDLEVDLNEIWGPSGSFVREELSEKPTPHAMLETLERRLEGRLDLNLNDDGPLVRFAISCFEQNQSVSKTLQSANVSRGHLVRAFSRHVGLSPKQYSALARFQRVVKHLALCKDDLASTAVVCGYYDQAHMTHAFRKYSGITPGTYVGRAGAPNHVVF